MSSQYGASGKWIIHRHWTDRPRLGDDSLHTTLMELLASGSVRQMSFDTFTTEPLMLQSSSAGLSDG
jgi:hypothetical protein